MERMSIGPRTRLAAFALTIGGLFTIVALSGSLSTESVQDWIEPYGVAAPLVFIVVASALTVALFPGPLLGGAAGLLFGTAGGTVVAIISATTGACCAFLVSRRFAHDSVEALAGPRIQALQIAIERRGFLAVLYARIAPAVPYNLVNYAAGLTRIKLRDFALATAIGSAPRAFAYAALGGSLHNLTSPEAIAAVIVLVLMAVLAGVIAYVTRARGSRRSAVGG